MCGVWWCGVRGATLHPHLVGALTYSSPTRQVTTRAMSGHGGKCRVARGQVKVRGHLPCCLSAYEGREQTTEEHSREEESLNAEFLASTRGKKVRILRGCKQALIIANYCCSCFLTYLAGLLVCVIAGFELWATLVLVYKPK